MVDSFFDDIISSKKVSKWWGTETVAINNLYRIKSSKELFEYLKQFETFCKYFECGVNEESLKRGNYSEITDFGIDDIAFYDKNNNYLLYTTTHEGYITVADKLIK